MKKPQTNWLVYILECKDGTLYTGITNNLESRIAAHENGTGAKYTKGRGPFKVIYTEVSLSHSDALKREMQIKGMARAEKMLLKQAEAAAKK